MVTRATPSEEVLIAESRVRAKRRRMPHSLRQVVLAVRRPHLVASFGCRHRPRHPAQGGVGVRRSAMDFDEAQEVRERPRLRVVARRDDRRPELCKQHRDPAGWMPPKAKCRYATHWVAVKYRWRLGIDSRERAKLASILRGTCGGKRLTVPRPAAVTATSRTSGSSTTTTTPTVNYSGWPGAF